MGNDSWVIRIACEPREPDSTEMFELVMAGASLELPLVVVFSGAGRRHLVGDSARRWQQLLDFDLARLVFRGELDVAFRPELRCEVLDDAAIADICRGAKGVLYL